MSVNNELATQPHLSVRPRVLYADDCEHSRAYLEALIGSLDIPVSLAKDGAECVEIFDQAKASGEPFNLVFLDLSMPELDGFETAKELRKRGFVNPIVAITGTASLGTKRESIQSGCDTFLSKRSLNETLIPTIFRLLDPTQ